MSFSWLSLRRMRELAPSITTVYLMERVPLRLRDGSLPAGVRIAGPSHRDAAGAPEVRSPVQRAR